MKKLKTAFLSAALFLLAALVASAQNYQPFRKGLTYHYIAQDSIYSLRVDSVKVVAGDSVFVFNQMVKKGTIRTGPAQCIGLQSAYHIQRNNLYGFSMKRLPNREYLFKAAQGNEFLLKTMVPVGTSWTFCSNPFITATLSTSAQETFSGISDQVLTYTLSNGHQIKLSRNYGLIRCPSFMSFVPNSGFPFKILEVHKLPDAVNIYTNPPIFKYFDFQPGDKFSFLSDTSMGFQTIYTWDQYQILTRSNSALGDLIIYTVEQTRLKKVTSGFFPTTAVLYQPKIITWSFLGLELENELSLLTAGFIKSGAAFYNQGTILSSTTRSAKFNYREKNYYKNNRFDFSDPCSRFILSFSLTHFGNDSEYTPGLGKTGEWTTHANSYHTSRVLEAYVKGSEIFGTWPMLRQMYSQIMATNKASESSSINAYPNPFFSEISLQFNHSFSAGKASVSVSNVLGQEVLKQEIAVSPGQENRLELGQLPKGMYMLKAEQNGKVFTTRLVKE